VWGCEWACRASAWKSAAHQNRIDLSQTWRGSARRGCAFSLSLRDTVADAQDRLVIAAPTATCVPAG
jgi:hypothetical protein